MLFLLIGWSALIAGCIIILLAFVQYFVASSLSAVQKRCSVSVSTCFSLFIIMDSGDGSLIIMMIITMISNSRTYNFTASFCL